MATTDETTAKDRRLTMSLIQSYWDKYCLWAGILVSLVCFALLLNMLHWVQNWHPTYTPPEYVHTPFPIASPPPWAKKWGAVSEPLSS